MHHLQVQSSVCVIPSSAALWSGKELMQICCVQTLAGEAFRPATGSAVESDVMTFCLLFSSVNNPW